ncbi:hypothetical protein ANTRET_LOCUS8317 [Anthophora retusa]
MITWILRITCLKFREEYVAAKEKFDWTQNGNGTREPFELTRRDFARYANKPYLCFSNLCSCEKNSMYKVLHNQDIKHECSRSGGLHAYPDHFREPKKLYL